MTVVHTQAFAELRQLFGAYLNAEFVTAHGTVAAALAAYRRETGAAHRTAARDELDRLTAQPGAALGLGDDLAALGCEVALGNAAAAWALAAEVRRALD